MRATPALSLCAAALAFTVTAAAQETKVAIGISGWTGFAPLTLAKEAGIFKKNGVDVSIKNIARCGKVAGLSGSQPVGEERHSEPKTAGVAVVKRGQVSVEGQGHTAHVDRLSDHIRRRMCRNLPAGKKTEQLRPCEPPLPAAPDPLSPEQAGIAPAAD